MSRVKAIIANPAHFLLASARSSMRRAIVPSSWRTITEVEMSSAGPSSTHQQLDALESRAKQQGARP